MSEIRTTTMKSENDNIICDFVRIYNNIFPLKLESEYINLSYLVNSYIVLCNRLTKANDASAKSTTSNTKLLEELESIDQDLSTIVPKLNEFAGSISKESASKDVQELYELARRMSIITRRRETLNSQVDSNNQTYYTQENDISVIRAELANIVLQIKEQLRSISMLDIDGKKRIDCLEVKTSHLEVIDRWEMLEDDKEALKDRLQRYFDFRVILFKQIESFAQELVPAYGQRQIYNGEYDDVIPAFFALAGIDITQDMIGLYFSTTYADEKEAYQFITDYFKTGICNVELGMNLLKGRLSWALKESILDITNHAKVKNIENRGPKK